MLAHADAVAEHGAAADRARRIDGDHRDLEATAQPGAEQGVDEARLAAAGHAGDADDVGAAGARREVRCGGVARAGRVVVEQRQQARQGAPVAGQRRFAQGRGGDGGGVGCHASDEGQRLAEAEVAAQPPADLLVGQAGPRRIDDGAEDVQLLVARGTRQARRAPPAPRRASAPPSRP